MKKDTKLKNVLIIFLLINSLLISLINVNQVSAEDISPSWPTDWDYFSLDPNEDTVGPQHDRRDIHHSYYYFDENFLYLRLECYGTPDFNEEPDCRYKWFIDLDHDGHFSGQNIVEGEFLLFVEDFDNNSVNNDGIGDVFLLEDLDSNGEFDEWEVPPNYYSNGLVLDPNIAGYRILGNCLDLYVNLSFIGYPIDSCFLWATDQENANLNQGPTLDSINIADISIEKTDNLDPILEGKFLNYIIDVSNLGPDTAENVNVSDILPLGVTYNSANPSPNGNSDLNYWWLFSTINSGDTETITINVTVDIGTTGFITNNVNAFSATHDLLTSNNIDSEDTTVNSMNIPPIANNDYYNVAEDTTLNIVAPGVLGNDMDVENNPLSAILLSGVSWGSLIFNGDGSFSYTPDSDYNGIDSFTYVANDSLADSDIATVTITVSNVNDAPLAFDDTISVNEDSEKFQLDVLINDFDIDNDDLDIISITQPSNGTATFTKNYVLYSPDHNYNGLDQLNYTISDNKGGTDTAKININVTSQNDPPLSPYNPIPLNLAINIDTSAYLYWNCSDPDNDPLSFDIYFGTSNPPPLLVKNLTDNKYKPSLNYDKRYYWKVIARDNHGSYKTSEIWIFSIKSFMNVEENRRPQANDDNAITSINTSIWIDVLANDKDVDGKLDPTTVEITNLPNNGITTINKSTGEIKYKPKINFKGKDSFNYKVKDNAGAFSDIAEVSIAVGGVKADASAGSPYYGFIGEEIIFNGSLSLDPDPDGFIVNWFWDFGDETNGTGEITKHIYSNIGNYAASLTVTDNENDTDKDVFNVIITISNNPPTKPIISGLKYGQKNIYYDFTISSTDSDNDTIQYIISWGDGQSIQTEYLPNGTSTYHTHNWSNFGKYIISVIAFDNYTYSETSEFTILIDVLPLDEIKGVLIDLNSDTTFDVFHNLNTGKRTDLDKENNTYLIDRNDDGKWDHTYNDSIGLLTYYEYVYHKIYPLVQEDLQKLEAPGFEIIILLAAIVILFIVLRKRR